MLRRIQFWHVPHTVYILQHWYTDCCAVMYLYICDKFSYDWRKSIVVCVRRMPAILRNLTKSRWKKPMDIFEMKTFRMKWSRKRQKKNAWKPFACLWIPMNRVITSKYHATHCHTAAFSTTVFYCCCFFMQSLAIRIVYIDSFADAFQHFDVFFTYVFVLLSKLR